MSVSLLQVFLIEKTQMNAPDERGQEKFRQVQTLLLWDSLSESVDDPMLFPMFRVFSSHLPEHLRADWGRAEIIMKRLEELNSDPSNLAENETLELRNLKEAFREYRVSLTAFIATFIEQLDPETSTELSDAMREEDVHKVNGILDKCGDVFEQTRERINE